MAGARLGFGAACPSLIADLINIKYSTNPYNVNTVTAALGIGVLKDEAQTRKNCNEIISNREYTASELVKLGFTVTNSSANFLFVKSDRIGGQALYEKLKERGILVRHFSAKEIADYNRITVGSMEQMNALLNAIKNILE